MLRLEEILKERNMNVTDLETRMKKRGTKLSRLSISKIINNVTSPKVSTLEDIANALDLDIRDMFDYTEEDKSTKDLIAELKNTIIKLESKI